MDISVLEILGVIGAFTYLYTYAVLQWRRDYAKTVAYSFLNFLAACLVLISLFENWNLPSAIIQISWMVISLYGLRRCLKYIKRDQQLHKEKAASLDAA